MKALSNTVNEESPLHHEYICESTVQPMTFQGKEYQTEVSILFLTSRCLRLVTSGLSASQKAMGFKA